jgi:hypothetical protein
VVDWQVLSTPVNREIAQVPGRMLGKCVAIPSVPVGKFLSFLKLRFLFIKQVSRCCGGSQGNTWAGLEDKQGFAIMRWSKEVSRWEIVLVGTEGLEEDKVTLWAVFFLVDFFFLRQMSLCGQSWPGTHDTPGSHSSL